MAWIAVESHTTLGAVAGQSITEGCLVELSASGLHKDLPTAMLAASGALNVFVAIVPPDNFPRPTFESMFQYPDYPGSVISPLQASPNLYWSERQYRVGPSLFEEPVALSGWKLQLHKGGAYTVTSGCFIDTANIRLAGKLVRPAGDGTGRFEYTATAAQAIGYVREYRGGMLTVQLSDSIH